MQIFLRDHNQGLVDAWKAENIPNAIIECGDIFSTPAEAIVSPANSFGFMDGGIDGVYTRRFGRGVQDSIQQTLKSHHYQGELLVGQAVIAYTNDPDFPICISAPTMRVPMKIHDPIDVYLSTRAAMRLAIQWDLESILFPGMGTSVGQVDPVTAARQMAKGIADALKPEAYPVSLGEASRRHYGALTQVMRTKFKTPGN